MTEISRRAMLAAPVAVVLAAPGMRALAGEAVTAPIRIDYDRVLIAVTIDGHGPYDFIIDTGTVVSGIVDSLGKKLGLKVIRHVRLGGVAGVDEFPLYAGRDVVLGGTIRQPQMALFGLPPVGPASGILAAGLLTTMDSDLNLSEGRLSLYPQGRGERTGYVKLDADIRDDGGVNGSSRIVVTVLVDGQPVRLLVDTGMPRALTLFVQAPMWSSLWKSGKPYALSLARGISGPEAKPQRLMRAGSVAVGGLTIPSPIIGLQAFASREATDLDGIVGLDVLRRFDISVEPAAKAVWFKPNDVTPPPRDYNRAGIWLALEGDRPGRIAEVCPGSPAEEAGLKAGDIVRGRRPPAEMPHAFVRPAGSVVPLEVERDGKSRMVALTLRDYL